MGALLSFPFARPELEELRGFGTVSGFTVSMLREKGRAGAPITIALVGDTPGAGLHGVMSFRPEGREIADIVGDTVVRTLRVVALSPCSVETLQNWGVVTGRGSA